MVENAYTVAAHAGADFERGKLGHRNDEVPLGEDLVSGDDSDYEPIRLVPAKKQMVRPTAATTRPRRKVKAVAAPAAALRGSRARRGGF